MICDKRKRGMFHRSFKELYLLFLNVIIILQILFKDKRFLYAFFKTKILKQYFLMTIYTDYSNVLSLSVYFL